jgi:transcription initiation factor IIE alpha subunit
LALAFHCLPWEIEGDKVTRWMRYIWRLRMELYLSELNAKRQREIDEMRNQNG